MRTDWARPDHDNKHTKKQNGKSTLQQTPASKSDTLQDAEIHLVMMCLLTQQCVNSSGIWFEDKLKSLTDDMLYWVAMIVWFPLVLAHFESLLEQNKENSFIFLWEMEPVHSLSFTTEVKYITKINK